ncbi:alpha-1,2-fucosyltransferase [Cupriavidus sp. SK-4]|uniref:alpha-1,2-fucosyltransferase n=1 Tax=Cupriavidus sp. SK-4 TaxID=574750 RepID=UPI0004456B41|nr:alpha-1,2-fucosyltransferase [Cupriavidus sp. SK-4]EYS96939.1 alpha-1,2-fucosyltransferase [Cupriavidus sp. SK-4]
MIVTRVIGGLGNQMFQYAAGRALARRLGVPLKIDSSGFADYPLHNYGLHHFALKAVQAGDREIPSGRAENRWAKALRRFGLGTELRVFRERGFAVDPEVMKLPDGTYLDGYWQSESYFAEMTQELRRDFQIATPPTSENAEWLARIGGDEGAVSIHVRRGDYVTNASANAVHGTCSLDYYMRAARYVAENIGVKPTFYVFSDDPDWVAENLHLGHETRYVRHNDSARNYEDLRLMSACRHHIIANSTFSWWGAWLNASEKKVVIAPAQWFRDEKFDTRDLLPPTWTKL